MPNFFKKNIFSLILCLWGTTFLYAKKPERIISLMPSNTEIVYDLGFGDRLVGVTSYCNFPQDAKTKEKVGNFIHPNFEKIISLNPDLILAGNWKSSPITSRLRKQNLVVEEIIFPSSLQEIYQTIKQISRALQEEKSSEIYLETLKKQEQKILKLAAQRKKKPTFYIEVDPPNWTVSKNSYVSDILEKCGAINVFRDLPLAGAQISWEIVLEKNPDIIIVSGLTKQEVAARPGWKNLSAVKNGFIIDKNDGLVLNRPSKQVFKGMQRFCELLEKFGF